MSWKLTSDIVISGISGRFPEADSVEELWHKLMNEIPMYTRDARRWPVGLVNLPPNAGKIKDISKFDADMFGVDEKTAHDMDPQMRLLHEVVYETLWDAGYDPNDLRGSKTGMYIGSCYDDTLAAWREDDTKLRPQFPFASRISYAMDWKGPVIQIDTACASSFSCFMEALVAINSGVCDRCIIAGLAIQLRPAITNAFFNLKMLSPDGTSKCLDGSADGYCRSEAVVALLLERESVAKRVYSKVLNCRTNCDGYKQEGITFPGYETQLKLLQEVYSTADVSPLDVNYVEAHITGTQAGDPVESNAIINALRPNSSNKPIMFGCLKSSIGHSEGASALCSLTKVSKILQSGYIPPNLNYNRPNPNIKPLVDGVIKPVTKITPFQEDLVAVNSFGFGGVNVHAIVQANSKRSTAESWRLVDPATQLPRLVNLCNRTEEGLLYTIAHFEKNRSEVNREFLQLLHDVSKIPVESGLKGRGYIILTDDSILKKFTHEMALSKSIWLATSPPFNSLRDFHKILRQFKPCQESLASSSSIIQQNLKIDLNMISSKNSSPDRIAEILQSTCIHLALINLLKTLKISSDGIVGHSLGQLLAGYADGCLSQEQSILAIYWISKLIHESGSKNVQQLLACKPIMEGDSLRLKLKHKLDQIIPKNVNQSPRWSSNGKAALIGSDFFIDSVLNPSLADLKRSFSRMPENSLLLRIDSESSFLSDLVGDVTTVSMMSSSCRDPLSSSVQILEAIGQVYAAGKYPLIDRLYPTVEYPVPRETPTLSHFLKWDHSKTWLVAKYPEYFNFVQSQNTYMLDIVLPEHKYIEDHNIDGRVLFPAMGYLWLAWDYASRVTGGRRRTTSIVFRTVKFHRATIMSKDSPTRLDIRINQQTSEFTVVEGNSLVVTGKIEVPNGAIPNYKSLMKDTSASDTITLKTKDIYKDLRLRGYDYGPFFQGLVEAKSDGSYGKVAYKDQWVSFADALMQVAILGNSTQQLYLPTYIEYLRCDPTILNNSFEEAKKLTGEACLDVYFDRNAKIGATNGLMIQGLKASPAPRRLNTQNVLLEDYLFVPYDNEILLSGEKVKTLQEYSFMCGECLKKIADPKSELTNEDAIKRLLERVTDDYSLLKCLYDTLMKADEFSQEADRKSLLKQTLDQNIELISKDVLTCQAVKETIYDQIHVVAENLSIKNIVLTEFNETYEFLHDFVMDTFNVLGIRSKVNLIHPNPEIAEKYSRCKPIKNSMDSKGMSLSETSDLIIVKDPRLCPVVNATSALRSLDMENLLENVKKNLKSGGFLLVCYRKSIEQIEEELLTCLGIDQCNLDDLANLPKVAESLGFLRISENYMRHRDLVSILYRKPSKPEETVTFEITDNFEWIQPVKEAIASATDRKVWLVSTRTPLTGIVGMVNCLRREPKGDRIRCFYDGGENEQKVELTEDLLAKDLLFNVCKRNKIGSYRHRQMDPREDTITQARHVYLDVKTKGDLSSLRWYRATHNNWARIYPDLNGLKLGLCDVHYGALNFKDVMVATGRIPVDAYPNITLSDCLIGMEFSGVTQEGKRIMGIVENKSLATSVIYMEKCFIYDVPDHWTLEAAATVPLVYLTAYYALFLRGNLQPGDKVLIHAGSGGVGQAAISICLKRGCEVFTTVGTQQKREFLKKTFPQLDDGHIGDSRSSSFEEMILKKTNGRGVDIVLNSLAEEKFKSSVRCLAEFGRFLEIGKYDLVQNNPLEETLMDGNRTFHSICVAHLQDDFEHKRPHAIEMKKTLDYLIYRGIENGEVRPLSTVVFGMDQAEEAFRYMATGKHIGKVLIKIREEAENGREYCKLYPCIAQTSFNWEKSYIITGGLGGVGLELARWMVERGAKKLVLTSRNGPREPYQHLALHRLRTCGLMKTTIVVSQNDGQTLASVATLLEEAASLGPIGGIFHLAMVLNDAIFENQSEETFRISCGPKVKTTKYLDSLSRKMCPELDYFVCFSSVASGKGNPGQTNYAFANSYMERLCEQRVQDGLPGLAVQWGAIGDVGVVAEQFGGNQVVLGGTLPQRIPSCMEVLDKFLQASVSSSLIVGSSIVLADAKKSLATGKENLLRSVCHVIGIKDMSKLDPNVTLSELGLDSLMAVEIKQGLERDYDVILSTQDIRNLKIREIQELEERNMKGKAGRKAGESNKVDTIDLVITVAKELSVHLNEQTSGVPVYVFPPLEGNFKSIKPLIQSIDRPVIGLNWTEECNGMESLEQAGTYYVSKITEQNSNQSGFDLIGYSFGGLVALEVAIQLQAKMGKNAVRSLILLDSSPSKARAACAELVKSHQLVTENEAHSIRSSLLAASSKEERMNKINQLLEAQLGKSVDVNLLTESANLYFKKMKMIYYYKSNAKYIGNAIAFKASDSYGKAFKEANIQELGLEEVIDGNVEIVELSGDHRSFLALHQDEIAEKLYKTLSYIIS